MTNVNYYQVLGVSENAEDFVIRAAYKALVQRYHPDKYKGSKDEAIKKMQLLNEAYDMLSDIIKRRNYDASLNAEQQSHQKSKPEIEADRAWKLVLEYYPELNKTLARLTLFSDELAEEYKLGLLESKRFKEHLVLAKEAEQSFLEDYFGSDPAVVRFARELLLEGNKRAAKEFNKTLMTMGSSVNNQDIIDTIYRKHKPLAWQKKQEFDKKEKEKRAKVVEAARQRLDQNEWNKDDYPHSLEAYQKKFGVSVKQIQESIGRGEVRSSLFDGALYLEDKDPRVNSSSKTGSVIVWLIVLLLLALIINSQ